MLPVSRVSGRVCCVLLCVCVCVTVFVSALVTVGVHGSTCLLTLADSSCLLIQCARQHLWMGG